MYTTLAKECGKLLSLSKPPLEYMPLLSRIVRFVLHLSLVYTTFLELGLRLSSDFFGDIWQCKVEKTVERGIDSLSRNVGNQLTAYAAYRPRREQTSTTPRAKQ
jgi:hypothetical protein